MAMESSANVPGSLLASHDSTNSHASSSKMLLDDSPPSLDPRPSTSQPTEDHDTTSAAAVLPPSPPLSLPSLSKPRASAFPTSLSDFRLHSPACSPAASSSSSSGALSSYAFPSSSATTPAPSAAPLGPTNLPTPTPTQDAGSASSSSDDSASAYLATPTPASSSTFRRKTPSASAIIAGRFRRSSMLGREVTPDLLLDEAIDETGPTKEEEEEAHDGSLEDADMRSFDEDNGAAAGPSVSPVPARTPSPHPSTTAIGLSTASARRHTTSTTPLLSAQRRFTASSSPSSTPGATESDSVSTRHTPGRTLAGRRMAGRKTGPLFRDRSVLRVAASLCDESSPADSEIASEAKLQRRVKSDCAASPRSSISSTSHQYFQPHLAPGQPWPKNCDLEDGGNPYVELAGGDHLDFEEDISSMSSDDDDIADEDGVFGGSARGFARAGMRRRPGAGSDAEVEMSYNAGTGATTIPVPNGKGKNSTAGASATAAADGSTPSGSDTTPLSTSMPTLSNLTKKGAQWTNFRASPRARSSARTSPGVERIFHHRPRTPGAGSTHVGAAAAATAAAIASAASPSSTSSGMMLVDTSTSSISSNSTDMLQHQQQQQQQQAVLNAIAGGLSPRLVSPSMWTFARQQHVGGKRKFGGGASDHERFEPYATSAAKRRAVSPIAYLAASAAASSANGGSNSTSSSSTSPALSALSGTGPVPVPILALNTSMNAGGRGPDSSSAASSPLGGAVSVNGLPLPTPLSMPSPTNPLIQPFWNGAIPHHYHPYHPHHPNHHHRTLSGPYGRSASAFATAAAASSSSRSGSPATRPSTPTNLLGPGGANGNKSGAGGAAAAAGTTTTLAASSAPASSVPSVTFREIVSMGLASPSLLATQTPGSAGSGPGYGSMPAALGLSLGGNSAARVKDEEEEEGSREGMDEGVRMLGLS
ncbi:hypothetical protein OC846_002151 [Tilletia horrida]|uniref:Uncharacterized protein n=1 Tax=Tilletia horrida TaxID=155126 RepID=A0AAN6JT73_9BASI|nr:hypothetical protein OC846_002151 [Tilletia horrida]